jgi:cytochrome oxidase Cu insertion factor (SCO1/SenC/PrrC family)
MTAFEAPPRRAAGAWLRWLRVGVLAMAVPVAGLLGFALGEGRPAATPELPVLRAAPSYDLTNQLGQPVSSQSFRGKVQLVTFLDPYCTDTCPLVAANLANFEHLAAVPAGIANKVQIVAFNLDPKNAGPAQMRAFLKQYGWNPDDLHWQYLTGSPAVVRHVVRDGFMVAYEAAPHSSAPSETAGGDLQMVEPEVVNKLAEQFHRGYDIVHDDVIEVVDQRGRIRKIYENADTVGWTRMLAVVQNLLGKPNRTG